MIDGPAPEDRQHNKPTSIRCVNAAKVCGLISGHNPIEDQDHGTDQPETPVTAPAPPLPD